jgi:pimeloyl-ACP methyl ester carboxylesterase
MPGVSTKLPPVEHRVAHVNGIRLHYVELPADRPPMLLLHGIGMDWRVWQAISRQLHPYFHLYMLDLRGHGESEKPSTGYTLAHYAADVEELLEQLNLRDVTLVGSSLGGMVAIVIEAPVDMVARRILVDPPIRHEHSPSLHLFRRILEIKTSAVTPAQKEQAIFDVLQRVNPHAGRLYLRYMAESWLRTAPGVLEAVLKQPETYFDVEEILPSVDSPTLVMRADPALGGALDASEAEHAVRLLPRGKLIYFPGAEHAIHGSQPRQFVQAILAFMREDEAEQS